MCSVRCFCIAAILAIACRAQPHAAPIRIAFNCTAAVTEAAGLACSNEEPCPVLLELTAVEAVGSKLFFTGNFHTNSATLASVLLVSTDNGATWSEAHAPIPLATLEQIQFVDFETGWASGHIARAVPRDPFLLLTSDGGKSWSQRALLEEGRSGGIEQFWFDSRNQGMVLVDVHTGLRYELYDTNTGGQSWTLRQVSAEPIPFPKRARSASPWRIRPNAAARTFVLEHLNGSEWSAVSALALDAGACRE